MLNAFISVVMLFLFKCTCIKHSIYRKGNTAGLGLRCIPRRQALHAYITSDTSIIYYNVYLNIVGNSYAIFMFLFVFTYVEIPINRKVL